MTVHVGDIRKKDCFRGCPPADLVTFNNILYYLPDNGKQGIINCLRFLQPRYIVMSQSPVENEGVFLVCQRSYCWNSIEASLAKIASSTFKLPKEAGWPGTRLLVLYKVVYKLKVPM